MWKKLGLVLWLGPLACGGNAPSPKTPPPSDEPVVVTPAPSSTPSTPTDAPKKPVTTTELEPPSPVSPTTIGCGRTRRQARFDFEEPMAGDRSSLLGFAAPVAPARPKVNSHVRREAAIAKPSLEVAKAIDGASIDTSACAAITTKKRNATLELDVSAGVVKFVTRQDESDDLLKCVMQSLCGVSLGTASGKATVAFRLRPMTDRPLVKPKSGTPTSAQKEMIEVVGEGAAACEQGQKLGSKPTSGVVTVGATSHSSVPPTMTITFGGLTGMNKCMTERIDGFRLPVELFTPVPDITLDVTWDG